MATLREIAAAAKVSTSTVSFVLNGRASELGISPTRVAQVRDIANRLGYRPNSSARAMRLQRSHHIGVLLANTADRPFHGPSCFETVVGINLELELHHYICSLVHINDTTGSNPRVFRESLLEGMIVIDMLPRDLAAHVENLMKCCVWIENALWRDCNCIRRDERYCASLLLDRCLQLGYDRVVWFGWAVRDAGTTREFVHYSDHERRQAIEAGCRKAGVPLDVLLYTSEQREAMADQLAAVLSPSTLVIAYDVTLARIAAMLGLERGVRVSTGFGLACCDENFEVRENWPELTRVSFDRIDLGRRAARMCMSVVTAPMDPHPSQLVRGEWVAGHTAPGPRRKRARGPAVAAPRRPR